MGSTPDGIAAAVREWIEKDFKEKRSDLRNVDMLVVRKLKLGCGHIAASG